MQTDLLDDQGIGDQDSLFGSPPPSPPRGRSPLLALPSGKQNVGTIALPGSHIYSELPVNPLASSLSPAPEQPHRPPAQYIQNQVHIPAYIPSPPPSISPSNSQPPTRAPSVVARKQKAKEREKKSTPRPTPPPIPLPDPDAPPPTNFLRNQQALLGMAGLVGGVNPATLSVQRHTRGSTSSNPIVVEDELNPPSLGYKTRFPPVDPALLPTPSNEQIVASLIKQKNIFPVLGSILKLIATGDSQNTAPLKRSAFECPSRSENEAPPGKKRKLGSVPAGAVDWDVPYPFSEGEGPQSYRTNWERERGKQLIAQLLGLINSAARTAATKTYFQQRQVPQRSVGYYRPAAVKHVSTSPPEVLADHSNGNITQLSPHNTHPTSSSGCQPSASFDQIIASLLASGEQSSLSGGPAGASSILTGGTDTPSENLTPDLDQGLFDNWMSLLQSFPAPEDGSSQPPSTTNPVKTSCPPNVLPTSTTGPNSPPKASEPSCDAMNIDTLPTYNSVSDAAIDPALLAISMPQAPASFSNFTGRLITPGSLPSPIASTSSLAEPLTPNGDATFPEPEIFSADQVEDPLLRLVEPMSTHQPASKPAPLPVQTPAYHLLPPPPVPSSSVPGPSTTPPPASKPLVKEDILRRARERRRQLSAEIARAKVELWEATIEQGVLAQLVKDTV